MPNDIAVLKIDFKIDAAGFIRIIDLGDGLGADQTGFEDSPLSATILADMYAATTSPLATIFGELPYDAMQSESIHVPLILREQLQTGKSLADATDLIDAQERFLPYSELSRSQSYVAYVCGKSTNKTIVPPIGLIGMEMHKVLWYFLMQKEMLAAQHVPVLYWNNYADPLDIDTSSLNIKHGVFIKIADRSDGGGTGVYYAKDAASLTSTISTLRKAYLESHERHMFVIEPAYMTLKKHNDQDYNVTGRAFITVMHDKETDCIDVKIAAAKWMFPLEALNVRSKTQNQMLSNIKHSIKMLNLEAAELQLLSAGILELYPMVFKAAFQYDNLMSYCADHPQINVFNICLKHNSSYKVFLDVFDSSNPHPDWTGQELIDVQVNTLIARDFIGPFNILLGRLEQESSSKALLLFTAKHSLEDIMGLICRFSFVERYLQQAKTYAHEFKAQFSFINPLLAKEHAIKSKLDGLIVKYLLLKDHKYDALDMNRALRQASRAGDVIVMRLLIYTHRANLRACSPTNQTALGNVLLNTNRSTQEQCLQLLKQAGLELHENECKNAVAPGQVFKREL